MPFRIARPHRDAWLRAMRIAIDEAGLATPHREQLWNQLETMAWNFTTHASPRASPTAGVRNPRVLLAAGVVVVAVVLGVVFLPGRGGETGEEPDRPTPVVPRTVRATLTLEAFQRPDTGARELLVSSPGPQFNGADLVRGTPIVWLRCFDATGAQAIRTPYDWPLVEEPGFPPHVHQPAGGSCSRASAAAG